MTATGNPGQARLRRATPAARGNITAMAICLTRNVTSGRLLLFVLAAALAGCTSGAPAASLRPSTSSPARHGAISLVTGRAPSPTDTSAPGIQLPHSAQLSVQVGTHNLVITGNNWNTITATSRVAENVSIAFGDDFDWTATTRNRFQYLADLIAEYNTVDGFAPMVIDDGVSNGSFVAIAALYDPLKRAGTLTGLIVTVIANPQRTVVAKSAFYATADSSLVIPGKTIYFVRLTFPSFTSPKSHNGSFNYTNLIHWDTFALI